ncbi:RNA polymerase sigma factor for flagellar operon FliA [Caldanaerobius fijiensis DSM 17918]|uniref:RNA polymerase sigma factor for flagellar operon FliA n=1 Tax=Caldanaerobius fijiensis DSM 17918 TaxID=1121256 RepID=A0A1M4XK16_9THEO|nr:FliA/WhiG family RNA polymerase sigma factor [Caldanaerobius fijiensis]SHE93761.1 RNA polymerase sigma factor for flagellar operon FliA [Caldanaerobius fijiensis DSM 17918]
MRDVDINKLWREYEATRSVELRNQIVLYYVPLVKYIVNRILIKYNNWEYDDILNQGILGLIDAVEKYESSKGVKFETYATYRIRGEILDYLRKKDWLPRSLRKKYKILQEIIDSSSDKSDIEIASEAGVSLDEYYKLLNYGNACNILSLDEMLENGVMNISHSSDTPDRIAEDHEIRTLLEEFIDGLPEKQKLVLSLYYVEGLTYKEIAMVLGVTESRISQIHSQAIKKLKEFFYKEKLVNQVI